MAFFGELLGSAVELQKRNDFLLDFVNRLIAGNAESLFGSVKHAGPVPLLVAFFIAAVAVFYLLIRGCSVLIRWYAAACGSAFVGVAAAALRDLHAAPASAGDCSPATGWQPCPRPAAPHRWYPPPSLAFPVACCACFQPVLGPQRGDGGGGAQCCELCGSVAHARCARSVPHNCRLLAAPYASRSSTATHSQVHTQMQVQPQAESGPGADGRQPTPCLLREQPDRPGHGAVTGGSTPCQHPRPPPSTPAVPLAHDWRPAGTTLDLILPADGGWEPGHAVAGGGTGVLSPSPSPVRGPPSLCVYCGAACEVGLLAVEPVWRCAGCRLYAHVQCWAALHPGLLSAATAAALAGAAQDELGDMPDSPRAAPFRWDVPDAEQGAEGGALPSGPLRPPSAASEPRQGGTLHRRCHSDPNIAKENQSGRQVHLSNAACAQGGSGGGVGGKAAGPTSPLGATAPRTLRRPPGLTPLLTNAPADNGSSHSAAHGRHGSGDLSWDGRRLAELDACRPEVSLGVLGSLILPPTAVLPAGPAPWGYGGSPSSPSASAAARPSKDSSPSRSTGGAAPATTGPGSGATGSGGGRSGRRKLSRALRQAGRWCAAHGAWPGVGGRASPAPDGGSPDRWVRLRVCAERLPPGCRPLLVAINPRSGPQAGEALRRQLLQLLHPLQVVDLSRESPSAALRCWWGVPGLRVVVVGGDGSAGWVLGEMEAVGAALKREAQEEADRAAAAAAAKEAAAAAARAAQGAVPAAAVKEAADTAGSGSGGRWSLRRRRKAHAEEVAAAVAVSPSAAVVGAEAGTAAETPSTHQAAAGAPSHAAAEAASPTGPAPAPAPVRRHVAPAPPLAILPLGTGNDLARVLGWGGGLGAIEARGGLAAALAEVAAAAPTRLDRWAVGITPHAAPKARRRSLLTRRRPGAGPAAVERQQGSQAPPNGSPATVKLMNNYMGVGIDAQCALQFHMMRERYPGWFRSQLGNKMWYTGVGARDLLARSCVDLPERLTLVCDGQMVRPPPSCQGLLFLNIASYMGGVDLWGGAVEAGEGGGARGAGQRSSVDLGVLGGLGETHVLAGPQGAGPGPGAACRWSQPGGPVSGDPRDPQQQQQQAPVLPPYPGMRPSGGLGPTAPQSSADGVLEVVAVFGAVHLGQLQVGLARATRVCRCRSATLTSRQPLPMQVDGEPWMQPPATITITAHGRALLLRRLDRASAAWRLLPVLSAVGGALDEAAAGGAISAAQRQALGELLARRLGAGQPV